MNIFKSLFYSFENSVVSNSIANIDEHVNILLYSFRTLSSISFFIWITMFGEISVIIVFALMVSLILWLFRQRWQILTLWFTIFASEGCTYIMKILFHRSRPLNAVFLEDSYSFPSGHATIAVAFYGFLTYLLIGKIKKRKYRVLIILCSFIIILAIGFSRLYLGVHYFSDVLVGYVVGLLGLIMGISITEWKLFQLCKASEKK